jgi:hypothetical protein
MQRLREEGKAWKDIGEKFGLDAEACRQRVRRAVLSAKGGSLNAKVHAEEFVGVEMDASSPRIASILAKGEVCLDNEFYVSKACVNEWGWNPATQEPYYQAKAWVMPIPNVDLLKRLRESLLKDLKKAVKLPRFSHDLRTRRGLLEVNTVDLHIGKRVWAQQCIDGTYNSDVAVSRGQEATTKFLGRLGPYAKEIILPIGHDLLHFDNVSFQTTAGTLMDTDAMYEEMYRIAVQFCRWQIESCASIAPVRVVIVRGNHDWHGAFHVGELLAAVYEDHPNVTVDNSVNPRKYYRWGQTLLGYAHGNKEKKQDLPLIMADEAAAEWAATRFHEWRVGHKHNKFEHEQFRTCGVRFMPSLTGTDRWHHEVGFRHHPRAEAYLFDLDEGQEMMMTHTAKIVS